LTADTRRGTSRGELREVPKHRCDGRQPVEFASQHKKRLGRRFLRCEDWSCGEIEVECVAHDLSESITADIGSLGFGE